MKAEDRKHLVKLLSEVDNQSDGEYVIALLKRDGFYVMHCSQPYGLPA